ncbi:DUF6759 domain-containing protein [Chryseobacterium caseinilyticum]|uniref:DUF6759 domain-containing protein n=1 Tax=Chryseobacterium caseinilyticum TaxID=2771428 RepID=A0ABR8ZEJ6_9FLAO|nr:DUF6759 domain-containing protein [Chryseobacterium caseinilyticum]MBD8083720.1 hypothetical protein [Chryseobacterium caseinilyticum]
MKKILFPLVFFSLIIQSCVTNEHRDSILNSTNIAEIEDYISKAHPEDPKRRVLKQRVIALKNAEWVKGRKNARPMAARPVILDLPSRNSFRKNSPESEAIFIKLLAETPEEHMLKTTQLLNTVFNQDLTNNEVILLLKNNSDCNLVLEISGKKFYNLPVPSKGENSVVLDKDTYTLSATVCDVPYKSIKEFSKGAVIILSNPEAVKNEPVEKKAEKTTVTSKKKVSSKSKKKK